MARYVLECPACEARFALRRLAPGRRVRCRKCRGVMAVPQADGSPPPRPPEPAVRPEVRRRLARIFALGRLAGVAGVLVALLAGGVWMLVRRSERAPAPPPAADPPRPAPTPEALEALRPALPYPLGAAGRWEYRLSGGGVEVRRVTALSRGPEGEPQFDVATTGGREPVAQLLRVAADGVYLVAERRDGIRHAYHPPMRIVPQPLFIEDRWEYEGEVVREGGGAEECRLSFAVAPDALDTPAGRRAGYRVHVTGRRGATRVDETLWYVKGIGIARRRTAWGEAVEEAELVAFWPR